MKKTVLILLFISLTSCLAINAPAVTSGMSEEDFKKKAKHEEMVRMEDGVTVYRVDYGFNGDKRLFYYFQEGKLVEMNEGLLRQKRYQIEHINN